MRRYGLLILFLLGCCGRFASDAQRAASSLSQGVLPGTPTLVSRVEHDAQCRQWVDSVLSGMSLKERIGQLFIYTIAPQREKHNRDLLRKVVKDYKIGGLLFSGGRLHDQAALTNEAQQQAKVPLLITFDGEWGLSMRLKETPVFPRNMVLGCIRNDSLLYEYGREMARQCRELGVHVNFAPVADVNINPDNPVINNRSFGENPDNVARKVVTYSRGLEDGGVLSVCKHFPGHGDTEVDSHLALPTLPFTRERLDSIELYPFRKAIAAGLGGIMVGHLDVPVLEPQGGVPSSMSRQVVNGLLQEELGFQGLTFTDALAMKGAGNDRTLCLRALKAGNDLLLVPRRIKEEVEAVLDAIKRGDLTEEEIDAKCRKVLTYKYALGLNKKPFIRLSGLESRIRRPETDSLIRRLKLASITVLGNEAGVLPLDPVVEEGAVLGVGDGQERQAFVKELSKHTRPVEFQLNKGLSEGDCKQLAGRLAAYKRILVCVTDPSLAGYRSFFEKFQSDVPVVYLFFVPGEKVAALQPGTPRPATAVLAHSTDEEVQRQVARLLYTSEAVADGRLSASIGGWFAAGEGTSLGPQAAPQLIPEEHGMSTPALAYIDSLALLGIREGAYPGCQVVVWKDGEVLHNRAYGTHVWNEAGKDSAALVKPDDLYDLASLTKTTATLLAVMKLYDKGLLSLTDYAADYLPWLKQSDKRKITIEDLLYHQSGLPATILFYRSAIDPDSYRGSLFRAARDDRHTCRIDARTWGNPNFKFREGIASPIETEEHKLQVCDSLWLNGSFRQEFLQQIADARLGAKRYCYSCVGFILLQQVVEAIAGLPMDEFLMQEFYQPMGLKRTGYLPLRWVPKEEVVPSAIDPFLRKSSLQGFVHDESAAFLGGVAGNAGLFSTAMETACIYQMLLNGGEWKGKRLLSAETCRLFTTSVSKISRRGLGFDRPDRRNAKYNPCAESAPASVYGHTGFTGTCAWADPENRMVFVFLCNRTYPNAWNRKLSQLNIRKQMQELLYQKDIP